MKSFHPNLPVKRDNHMLEHTFRMGLTTPEVLHRLFFPGATRNAVSQAVCRLVKHGYLKRHPINNKHRYYTLGHRCVRLMGAPRSKIESRGEQILPLDLATLAFCCLQQPIRRRLLPEEVLREYPWFPPEYLGQPYVWIMDGGERRLAVIKVELAEFSHRVIHKHQKQFRTMRECKPLDDLFEQQKFAVVTVTTTPERRKFLESLFEADPWYPPFSVFDYPLLCDLL